MANDVTLDDVAKKSGVSRATASRALNGRDGVRADVRERVTLVASAMGYRPNRAAKNLAGGRMSVIGLVLGVDELPTNLYAATLVQSMAMAANRHDEGLMLLMDSKQPTDSVGNLLRDGLVEGVIVSAVAIGERWVEQLLDAQIPTVLVGAHPGRRDIHVVDTENLESSAAVVGHLIDAGASRVGIITGPLEQVDATLRLEGYRLAHRRRGLDPDPSLQFEGDFDRSSGYKASEALLAGGVDAVFASNDEMALGFLRGLAERGLVAPDDISVAGFDGTSSLDDGVQRLTTVEQPFDELALTAVSTLVRLINNEEVDREQLIEPTVAFRDTTPQVS